MPKRGGVREKVRIRKDPHKRGPPQIHWFSIFNSFMMVVFLCGLVALILMRTLKNDYARFTSEDDDLELVM